MAEASILVVDDDVELCSMLASLLRMEGYAPHCVHDARSGYEAARSGKFGLVVLDMMLPGGDGGKVLRLLRQNSAVPVIMLTARGEAKDRIMGLEAGADDYVAKPFVPGELIARIRAVLRRRSSIHLADPLIAGDLRVEIANHRMLRSEEEVELTSAEFDMLLILLRKLGQCVSRNDLSEQALGRPVGPLDRSIDNHMSNLRKKLGPHPSGRERIRNVRGVGYTYTGDTHV